MKYHMIDNICLDNPEVTSCKHFPGQGADDSQVSVAKVILGEVTPIAKNPITHAPFFEIEK